MTLQIRSLTKRRVFWLWALLPLLLAAALAIPLLDVDAFNGDEPASLLLRVQGPFAGRQPGLHYTQ